MSTKLGIRKTTIGWHTRYPSNRNCDRCTLPLKNSMIENTNIVYSTTMHPITGFLCIICAAKESLIKSKIKVTPENIKKYQEDMIKKLAITEELLIIN